MRYLAVILLLLSFSVNSYSQFGWYQQNPNTSNDLHGVGFFNENLGIIVGLGGTIRRTSEGGLNWNILSIGLSQSLHKVTSLDGDKWIIIGQNGLLLRSSNRGTAWSVIPSGISGNLNRIQFLNNNSGISDTGFVVGVNGALIKSTNGGQSWSTIATITSNNLYCLDFQNDNSGIVAGDNIILKTTNGGDNWHNITPGGSVVYQGIAFKDQNTGVVVGGSNFYSNGFIYRTTNGGNNWSTIISSQFGALKDAQYLPNGKISVIGNQSVILMSDDDGLNWTIQTNSSGVSSLLHDVCFVNDSAGFTVGTGGLVLKTLTGGVTGLSNIASTIPASFILHQNYPNPFNPSTRIKFDLPEASKVSLVVYNSLGQQVSSLIDKDLQPGVYEYTFNAENLKSGVYFYKLITNEFSEVKKMILVK